MGCRRLLVRVRVMGMLVRDAKSLGFFLCTFDRFRSKTGLVRDGSQ